MESIGDQAARVQATALSRVQEASDERELESLRVAYLGKKGELTALLRGVAALAISERPDAGRIVNESKDAVQRAIDERQASLLRDARAKDLGGVGVDLSLPSFGEDPGRIHPLSQITSEICDVLVGLGFDVAEGPEVEDDYHNFEALNIPADHPARDMQDTFFVRGGYVLRTHTSPVQIRVMEVSEPPIAIIVPGAVYRHGDDDATHSPMFHQIEGLLVDRGVHFGHLKFVLTALLQRLFGAEAAVRFRPSYFPFTEPSAEVDVGCVICGGAGRRGAEMCRVCKGTGWLEILGAGMVDPAVFEHVGYDPERFTGFAFGLGIERIAMLRYGIADIRGFFTGDLRFLEQF